MTDILKWRIVKSEPPYIKPVFGVFNPRMFKLEVGWDCEWIIFSNSPDYPERQTIHISTDEENWGYWELLEYHVDGCRGKATFTFGTPGRDILQRIELELIK